MKMNKKDQAELFAKLDEALGRVLKGEDINIVLADYARFADEIAPLLQTALSTRKAADIKPRPEFRERAAVDFQKAIQAMPVTTKQTARVSRWRMAWVMPVAVFIALLLSGAGVVAASTNSLPGSPLYSVKLAAENVQLAFTPSNLGKAELYAKFNDRRVNELVAIAANADGVQMAAEIDKLNTRMFSNMNSISELTGGAETVNTSGSKNILAVPSGAGSSEYLDDQGTASSTPASTTTAVIAPVATTTTNTLTIDVPSTQNTPPRTTTVTRTSVPETGTTLIVVPPATTTSVDDTESVEPDRMYSGNEHTSALTDEEQKLVSLLTEKQQENINKLEAAWVKAPEWLKPLIRQAIDIILYGYDNSISNLSY